MGILALLLLFLATLVKIDAQSCSLLDIESFITDRLLADAITEGTRSVNISLIDTNPNCLATAKEFGLYRSLSISVKYLSSDDNETKEIRHNYGCHPINNIWQFVNKSESYFNGTRTDCSDCSDQTVNDYHCKR